MIVAITGGRKHKVTQAELDAFDELLRELHADVVVHGAAPGVDTDVAAHVKRMRPRSIRVYGYPVDEALDGKWPAAGCIRNGRMLKESRAQKLVAFRGGSGTADCVRRAMVRGLPIWLIGPDGAVERLIY